jgi:hypothetical protein
MGRKTKKGAQLANARKPQVSSSANESPSLPTLFSSVDNRRQSGQQGNKILRVRDPLKAPSRSADAAELSLPSICEDPHIMMNLEGNVATSPLNSMSPMFSIVEMVSPDDGNPKPSDFYEAAALSQTYMGEAPMMELVKNQ